MQESPYWLSTAYIYYTHLLCNMYHHHRIGAFHKLFKRERDDKFNSSRIFQLLKLFDIGSQTLKMCVYPWSQIIWHFLHLFSTHSFILIAMPTLHSNPLYPPSFPASGHKILILYYHTSAGEPRMIHSCFMPMLLFQVFKAFHNLTLPVRPFPRTKLLL